MSHVSGRGFHFVWYLSNFTSFSEFLIEGSANKVLCLKQHSLTLFHCSFEVSGGFHTKSKKKQGFMRAGESSTRNKLCGGCLYFSISSQFLIHRQQIFRAVNMDCVFFPICRPHNCSFVPVGLFRNKQICHDWEKPSECSFKY